MPIDEGVNIDLQFLILEVKKQSKASLAMIERPSEAKLEKIRVREVYVCLLYTSPSPRDS